MSEHTKDPWSVEADPNCDAATLLDADGNDTILRGDYQDWWVTKADARRIVACVNACKGIATETLETLEDKTLNELFKRNCGEYQAERDELLAATERLLGAYRAIKPHGYPMSDAEKKAVEAIGKVKS